MEINIRLFLFTGTRKDEQVSFVFQRKRQQETRMLTNYAYKEWINEIHIPSELITITNQEVVGWKGEKIASNEELEATLDSPHIWKNIPYYGTLNESRDGVSFKKCAEKENICLRWNASWNWKPKTMTLRQRRNQTGFLRQKRSNGEITRHSLKWEEFCNHFA